ncbi:sh3 domain-containing kinase-binding protein 1 [Lasius niger]|uniref:Sh3 domain-containing kinase-binding protein 1 n=1 Tax=Lasius niger TaxID=67767 RepID=A0A0J7L5H5_LASNI|nr:sh3 domain-containing kinase-binding protein 1 [Lasius niger]
MEAIVEYNYVAQEDDELTLRKGDIITGIKMMLGGWWEGTLRDKRGMFPDNFVKILDSSTTGNGSNGGSSETVNNTKSDEVTLRNGSGRRFCKVLFSYEPCNEDELALVPQDSIEFLGEVEEGWWRGRLKGRVGVFPSNFVSPPAPEEQERHKERDKKETYRVLFPYEAANEDELTLVEGDGWWKGELRGQVGLFPDNFVEMIGAKNESQEQESQWHEITSLSAKSSARHSHQVKKIEKAHVRKSLDTRNVHPSNISDHFPAIDTTTKKSLLTSSSTSVSTLASTWMSEPSPLTATGSGGGDKKAAGSHSIISSLKRFVSDVGNNNGIGNTTSATSECREELDGVERGEGAPLSHLTASRAKAPRRRPPSSQHLRHHAAGSTSVSASSTLPALPSVPNTLLEDNLSNGRTETTLEQIPDEETDGLAVKARRKAPWVEELKMNQMERRKTAADRVDKTEVKKERNFSRLMTQGNVTDSVNKPDIDNDDSKQKDKSPRADISPHVDHSPGASSGQPAYVPYALYSKLLERVAALEEKQAVLQVTVGQLSEQLVPLLANASINNKV